MHTDFLIPSPRTEAADLKVPACQEHARHRQPAARPGSRSDPHQGGGHQQSPGEATAWTGLWLQPLWLKVPPLGKVTTTSAPRDDAACTWIQFWPFRVHPSPLPRWWPPLNSGRVCSSHPAPSLAPLALYPSPHQGTRCCCAWEEARAHIGLYYSHFGCIPDPAKAATSSTSWEKPWPMLDSALTPPLAQANPCQGNDPAHTGQCSLQIQLSHQSHWAHTDCRRMLLQKNTSSRLG